MVAIACPARPLATPAPARGSYGAPPLSLHLVVPGRRPVDLGPRQLAHLVLAVVLVVVAALSVAYLVRSDPLVPSDTVPVLDQTHVVHAGETMWSIATEVAPAGEAATYVERLVAVNGTASVAPGQVLALPIP